GGERAEAVGAGELADVGAGDDDEVVPRREPVGELPERLPQQPLDLVPRHGLAELAPDRDPEPNPLAVAVPVRPRERVHDEVAVRVRAPVAGRTTKASASRPPPAPPCLPRHRSGCTS